MESLAGGAALGVGQQDVRVLGEPADVLLRGLEGFHAEVTGLVAVDRVPGELARDNGLLPEDGFALLEATRRKDALPDRLVNLLDDEAALGIVDVRLHHDDDAAAGENNVWFSLCCGNCISSWLYSLFCS